MNDAIMISKLLKYNQLLQKFSLKQRNIIISGLVASNYVLYIQICYLVDKFLVKKSPIHEENFR